MKKHMVVLLPLLIFSSVLCSQTYSFDPSKVLYITLKIDSVKNAPIYINNLQPGNTLAFDWVNIENTLDTSWIDYSLCDFGHCYPGIPTGTWSANPIPVNGQGYFILDAYGKKTGSGSVKIKIWDKNNPSVIDTITFIVTVITGLEKNSANSTHISVYPSPTTDMIHLALQNTNNPSGFVYVADINGRVVLHQQTVTALTELSVTHLPNGVYSLSYIDPSGAVSSQRIIIAH